MSRKKPAQSNINVQESQPDRMAPYRVFLWLAFGANALFFWWQCLDRYLAPRFLFLSLALLGCLVWLWRDLKRHADWRLRPFDALLLGWLGWNMASTGWAFSWSEAVFYTQKVFLLFAVYWMLRQALQRDEGLVRSHLFRIHLWLTWIVCGILIIQLVIAAGRSGLNNEALYDYASAVYGNKSLASEFLFFLLVINGMFYREFARKQVFYATVSLQLILILLLQTRTTYLAVALGALFYFPLRAWLDEAFRPAFLKKIVPAGVLALVLLSGVLALKGHGSSLLERLNPATYLESVSANERRFVWYKTDLLNRDHYWLGVGNGSWKIWFPSKSIEGGYRLQEQNVVFTRAHNDYLEIRSELGIIGVALYCLLFVGAFFMAARLLKKNPEAAFRHEILALMAGLLGYCLIQYFDFPRERIEMQVVLAFLWAYIAFYDRKHRPDARAWQIQNAAGTFLGLLALGLALNVWIGWSRVTGEIHTVRAMDAQGRKNFRLLVQEAQKSRNIFNEYNDVAIPLQWHEGIGYYFLNDTEASVRAFEEAYRLSPWSFQVLNDYASALLKQGDVTKAIGVLEQAVTINPRFDEGKLSLSYAYMEQNDFSKAMEWINRIDTISNPQTEDARLKNRETLNRQALFLAEIQKRMAVGKK